MDKNLNPAFPDRSNPDIAEGVTFEVEVVFGSDNGRDLRGDHEALLAEGVHSEIEIYEGKAHAWFNKELLTK
jgi:hypothetical protein